MKKILFTAAGILALLHSFAQAPVDSAAFKSRKLRFEEANLVSSYYNQDGNNAAVTGGVGSQKLSDIATIFDVKLVKYDKRFRKNNIGVELGIDHYTSASSDMVDLKANSSASHADTRIYPSVSWSRENEVKGTTIGAGVSVSSEFDYQSFGGNISLAKKTHNRMGEFSIKAQAYLDRVKLVLPTELRPAAQDDDHYGSAARNTFAASLTYSQIINKQLQLMFLADVVQQNGFLSLPFYRVYFGNGSVHQEKLPSGRFKLPIGVRANYFAGDKIILRAYYRFYTDDWGLHSHTADLEVPVKLTPFLSVSPFYRFYSQSATRYFAAYGEHNAAQEFYSSNYDLSKFNSNFFGAGVRVAPPKGVFGIQRLAMLELRYGHYMKNINMNANIVSLNIKFK